MTARNWVSLALSSLLALAAGPTLAGQCVYTGLPSDNGPCIEVRNELDTVRFGNSEMNLWCLSGEPTATSHKIVLRPNPPDSFTCQGTQVKIQRVQVNCNTCTCENSSGSGKLVVKLYHEDLTIGFVTKKIERISDTCE